jgi:hypothetical protein
MNILHGDNIHDDTEAIQKWIDGDPAQWANGKAVTPESVSGITFKTSKPLRMDQSEPRAAAIVKAMIGKLSYQQ